MDIQLTPPEFSPVYFIAEEEMDDFMELHYPSDSPSRFYTCKCGCCLNCVGISDRDFM